MIEQVACDISTIVHLSGYVNTHSEWCELIRQGDKTYPAQYVGGGNYEQVHNHDVNGNSYLRKNGNVSFSAAPSRDKFIACGGNPFVQMTLPLRLVMVVPRSKLGDSAFSDEALAQDMIAMIQGASAVSGVGIQSLDYNVTGYNTDSLSIWSEEIKGVEFQMNFNYCYISINFNAVGVINPACLIPTCY